MKIFLCLSFLLVASTASAALTPLPEYLLTQNPKHRTRKTLIKNETNGSVNYWVSQFTGPLRERFALFLERGAVYRGLIEETLVKHGVPAELYYLAMIESGFIHDATSRASAAGIWQFMRPTGRAYGLRIDDEVDERLDPIRATSAAARHLRDLYRDHGSWHLAMAAYNAGSGRVRQAIRNGRTKNYWNLVRRGALPSETSHYVPQFHAAMKIARNPKKYGFEKLTPYKYPKLSKVRVKRGLSLEDIATNKRLSVEILRAVNPHLLQDSTPSGAGHYEVWVPKAHFGKHAWQGGSPSVKHASKFKSTGG